MPGTFFGLSIGTSGIYAAQAGMNTTAHNIANTETKGYTRQVANQMASTALRVNSTYGMAGTGVDITGITQIRDKYYDSKYMANNTMYGAYSTKEYYMSTIENYFNEVKLDGFVKSFDYMYNTIQELSKTPEDLTTRTQVTSYAQNTTEYINSLAVSLKSIQEECNFEIRNQVNRVNSLAQQIATITKQINTLEVTGGMANDLRDQRALMIDELSGFAKISVTEKVVGADVGVTSYQVTMDGYTLVDTYEANQLQVIPREHKVNQSDHEGLYEIYWSSGQKLNTESELLGGTLHALFEVRDGNNNQGFTGSANAKVGDTKVTITQSSINEIEKLNIAPEGVITIGNKEYSYNGFAVKQGAKPDELVYEFSLNEAVVYDADGESAHIGENMEYKGIPYYMSQLNQFVRTYAREFNKVHTNGVDLDGKDGLDFFNGTHTATGENFIFQDSPADIKNGYLFTSKSGSYEGDYVGEKNFASYYMMTASNFCITKEVYEDPKKFAAATEITNGVGNADNVEKLLALKNDVTMFRQGKPAQFFETLVAEIGIDSKKTENFAKNQKDILSAIENQRLSISGVDGEEEAMNLIRYQKAYGLSAKVISTLDEMFDRLINYMGA